MRWFRFSIFILIVALFQASNFLDWIAVTDLSIKPDLLLVCMIFFAMYCTSYEALIAVFAIGLAADLVGSAMGTHMISFGLIGCVLSYIRNVLILRKTTHQIVVVFVICFLTSVLIHLLSFLKISPQVSGLYTIMLGTSIYTALISPYLNSVLLKIGGWMGVRKYRFGPAVYR